MQRQVKKHQIVFIGLLLFSLVLSACQPAAPTPVEAPETEAPVAPATEAEEPVEEPEAPAAETEEPAVEEPADLIPIRVGMTPFFDYQFWSVADEFGWDEELGLDLQFTWLTQSGPSIQALATGELDTVNTCIVCNFPFYESVPEMVNFLNVNQFKGFVVIGRQGLSKSYEEFLTELGDPEAAKVAAIEQMRGKTFPIYLANYEPLLTAVLEQAGMTLDDVTTINFPDDEKAALAMIGGEGDFYMGGLPSEINLLMNHPDQFKLIGGSEILGPAGLWYSNIASNRDWLAANEEAALKVMAMSYRFNKYVQEDIGVVLPIVVEAMNAHSGVATDPEELEFIFDTFLDFRTYQQDQETAFNPDSDLYWEQSAQYYVERSQDLPEGADYLLVNPLNEWFEKFLAKSELLSWVDTELGAIGSEPEPTPPPDLTFSAEPVPVRVGMTPFFDYQFWSVADEFGWDEELGLDLQFTWLTQSGPSIQALATGELDTVNTCIVCNFPFYESVPEMVNFLNVNQFKGFVVIGRQGLSKSYEEFLTELGDPEAAKVAAIEQMRGKTFPIYLANYEPLLTAVLEQGGMTLDDVTTINFPDDEKAALAMIGGEGDFYMGGLPSELNLLMNHPDQFKLIGGSEILGPAGLWYSNIASTRDWLAANPEAAYRIMAMSYRYNRYVQEDFDAIKPIVIEAMNAHSGVATDPEELQYTFDTFLEFRTYQQDQETAFNPDSDLYWEQSAQYYVERSQDLPEGADYLLVNPLNEWFEQFLAQQALLDWVDAPLE